MQSSNIHGFLMICAISASYLALSSSTAVDFTGDRQFLHLPPESVCRSGSGSIAECQLAAEFEIPSEISRRILATTRRYISYSAMRRNTVPCSRRGASYYNCQAGAPANPYSRGCSAITRCRWWFWWFSFFFEKFWILTYFSLSIIKISNCFKYLFKVLLYLGAIL